MTCTLHSRTLPCTRCVEITAWLRAVIAAVHAGTTAEEIRGWKP